MPDQVSQQTRPELEELLTRIRGEYHEMPGLSLTLSQAQRLWALDRTTCITLLERLVEARFLRTTPKGLYALMEGTNSRRASPAEPTERSLDPMLL